MNGDADAGNAERSTPGLFCFGPFELDPVAGELRKYGVRVRLAEQPARALVYLLERPRQVVTRAELQEHLWPGETRVEFDRSLNAAVSKIRRALSDSSESPRYIETIPKRGYRFVSKVECVEPVVVAKAIEPEPAETPKLRISASRRLVFAAGLAAAGLAFLFYGTPLFMQASGYRFQARLLENVPARARFPSFSPDGRSIAYTWPDEDFNYDIYVQRLDQKTPIRITDDPASEGYPRWSPDGASLLFNRSFPAAQPGLYVASLVDGSMRRVGRATRGGATWMPDGKTLVYTGGNGRLASVSLESLEETPLVAAEKNVFQHSATVSPDGETTAYAQCGEAMSCDIYALPAGGGEPKRLSFDDGDVSGMAWTADGSEIVYALDGLLYRVDASGEGKPIRLEIQAAGLPLGEFAEPTLARPTPWGPMLLAFRRTRRDIDIWAYDLTAGDAALETPRRKLIDSPGVDYLPAYSPDGSSIAFLSDRDGAETALWIADADGRNQRRLTPPMYFVRYGAPSWAPDGSRLAFRASNSQDPIDHIYTVSVGGGEPRAVTEGGGETDPLWSRDGEWIYHRVRSPDGLGPEIRRAPADGSGPARIISESPVWSVAESPDGRYVYYCGGSNGESAHGRIYRVPAAGGEREIVRSPCLLSSYVTFHDGAIHFIRRDDRSRMAIERLDFETGEGTPVATLGRSAGLPYFSLSPDGTSVLAAHLESAENALMLVDDFR